MRSVSNQTNVQFLIFVNLLIAINSLAQSTVSRVYSLSDSVDASIQFNGSPVATAELELAQKMLKLIRQMDSGDLSLVEGRMAMKSLMASFRQIRVELLRREGTIHSYSFKDSHAQLIDAELSAKIQLDESQEKQIRRLLSESSRGRLDSTVFPELNSDSVHLDEMLFGDYRVEDKTLELQTTQQAFEKILYRMQLLQLWRLKNARRIHHGLDPITEDISLIRSLSDSTELE
jgi:hypothetical protein|tara:strand:+ start:55 stop:750 length:696 start_codon:yes stop_codon:yes gene_type:complete